MKQISCGATHIGLVTNDGKCFTWGNGENGMLGHGHKQNVASPQLVSAFSGQECTHISCGAYHTAVIADRRIQFVRVPGTPQAMRTSQSSPNLGGEGGVSNTFSPAATSYAGENYLQRKSDRYSDMYLRPGSPMRSQEEDEPRALVSPSDRAIEGGAMGGDTLMCGSLYTFGLGKAGQLGQGDLCQSSATPLLVASLNENGMSVARVSCGMHHTLIVALAAYNPRVFSPVVYSCGWGEHGRLGLGHEEQVNTPTQVTFSMPFHPTMVSAGEQHSLAAGRQGCYSWGSNSFGQCGAGNPNTTPFLLAPSKVPIPEGIKVSKIAAGGRHSAAVSYCGKLMSWGWGEEGQLGHGTEKNAHLPRPCKLPRVMSAVCTPTDVALGLCHTVVLVTNKNYDCKDDIKPVPKAEPVIEESKPPSPIQHPPQPIPDPDPFYIESIVPPRSPSPIEIRRPIPPMAAKTEEVVVIELKTPILKTPAKIVPPHRSPMEIVKNIEDLMKERDDRKTRDEVDVLTRYTTVVETPATPLTPVTIQAPPVQPLPVKEPEIEEPVSEKVEESALPPKKPPKSYEFDPKLNTAHRAEVRRLQKLAREEAEALAQNNGSTKRRGSGSSAGIVLEYVYFSKSQLIVLLKQELCLLTGVRLRRPQHDEIPSVAPKQTTTLAILENRIIM